MPLSTSHRSGVMSPAVRATLAAVAIHLLAACGGPFADAVKRGDQYAHAGMWDKAAAEYDTAQKLEPGNPEVAIKQRQVGQKRSAERLTRGQSLIARGEIEAGLAVVQEAAKLDPESADAQRALSDINQQVLQKAELLLASPEAPKAFDLTQLVLKGSPADPRAQRMDNQVRDVLAGQSYDRAEQFLASGKHGNALIEYAAATTYRPGFRDAKVQIGEAKLALSNELMFYVVLDRFATTAAAGEHDIALQLSPALVAQAFDERLALRVVAAAPGKTARGVRLRGALSGYRFGPARSSSRNEGCDYIRGYDTVPNPERAEAERRLADAEQRLAQADRDVDQNQKDVDRYQKEVDDKQKDVDRAESDVDRARADYERCQAQRASSSTPTSSSSSSACSSERSRYDSAQSQLQSRRGYTQSSQGYLTTARERVQRANESRARSRQDTEDYRRRMRDVPTTIQQPHHERENYTVEIRSIDAAVTLQLHAEGLIDQVTLIGDEVFPQALAPIVDEGWLARPATCPHQGKRLQLPGEDALRGELVKQTIATLRDKVTSMYDSYRTKFLADARRHEANGAPEEAVESYVRYLLTGTRNLDPKDGKQIAEFLKKTRGFGKIELLGSL